MENVYIKVEDLNKWIAKYFEKQDLITIDDLLAVIEELDGEVENLKMKYEELENNMHENYEQISSHRMYNINERDFH